MIKYLVAAAITISWQAPTQNVDGTPLTDLDAYRIFYGPAERTYDFSIDIEDETLTTYTFDPPPGQWYIAMTAIDADGNESAFSNEIVRTEEGEPLPPVILQQDEIVYMVITSSGRPNEFVLLPVGTVPAGTQCDPNNSVNGLQAVPTDAVQWTSESGARPITVVARCDG